MAGYYKNQMSNNALLACSGLAGSIPAASTKRIYLYAFLCVP